MHNEGSVIQLSPKQAALALIYTLLDENLTPEQRDRIRIGWNEYARRHNNGRK